MCCFHRKLQQERVNITIHGATIFRCFVYKVGLKIHNTIDVNLVSYDIVFLAGCLSGYPTPQRTSGK